MHEPEWYDGYRAGVRALAWYWLTTGLLVGMAIATVAHAVFR